MKQQPSTTQSRRAQAVIELAVFGAILLFIISGIIQQGTSAAFYQNQSLQTMRQALLMSYEGSKVKNMSRNMASYLLVEDRLSPSVGKYGTLDRQPLISMGSGVMSKVLYQPTDWIEYPGALPIVDVQVNGQKFTFKAGAAVTYFIRRNVNNDRVQIFVGTCDKCAVNANPACTLYMDSQYTSTDPTSSLKKMFENPAKRLAFEWKNYSPDGIYPPFYQAPALGNESWVDPVPGSADIDRRYDLGRDQYLTGDKSNFSNNPSAESYADFSWQWSWKKLSDVADKIDTKEGDYPSADVNGDKSEETIYALEGSGAYSCSGTGYQAYTAKVLDSNAGDMSSDTERDHFDSDEDISGLRTGTEVFTETCDDKGVCTNFEVREGRLLNTTTKQFASTSTQQKRQFDVISRTFQMNKRMIGNGTLCNGTNPVKCCDGQFCCGTADNFYKTCFSKTTKTLYIRSLIKDYRKQKWTTQTGRN